MIRVLHVISSMNRGGAETFIMNVYRNIDRSKVQFDFLLHTDKKCDFNEEILSLGGRIYSVPSRNLGFFKNINALNRFFQLHPEYNIVHQHLSSLSYATPLQMAFKNGVSVRIAHSHSTKEGGNHFHNFFHRWNQISVKSYVTNYFACSELAAKWLFGEKQFNSGEYTLINNGIETERFIYNPTVRRLMRNELGIEDKFVVGHIGNFVYPKNHNIIIKIFKNLYDRDSNSILLLVGDGSLRDKIEEQIINLGLVHNVIITGVRSNVEDFLQAMDVFIMPSHYEGLPVTLVEAQTAGLPCIVSSNITKQVKITDNIEFIDLSSPLSEWGDKVLKLKLNSHRKNEYENIISANFDIRIVAQYLQDVYTNN